MSCGVVPLEELIICLKIKRRVGRRTVFVHTRLRTVHFVGITVGSRKHLSLSRFRRVVEPRSRVSLRWADTWMVDALSGGRKNVREHEVDFQGQAMLERPGASVGS